MIEEVVERRPDPDPDAMFPDKVYSLKFPELEPGTYTIHMAVETEVNGEPVSFDIAETTIQKNGYFALEMPKNIPSECLGSVADWVEWMLESSILWRPDEKSNELEISDPEVGVCIARLYMVRESDGFWYNLTYGGSHKDSDRVTDTSSVFSLLFYAADAVTVKGTASYQSEVLGDAGLRFELNSVGGWSWIYCSVNGLNPYSYWKTAYPDWAVMSYKARGIYPD